MASDSLTRAMAEDTTPEERFELVGVHYPKVPVCRRQGYEICFEQFGDYTFIHVRMSHAWSPALKRDFMSDAQSLLKLHGGPVFVLATSPKLRKFCLMAGFKHAMHVTTKDGDLQEILALQAMPALTVNKEQETCQVAYSGVEPPHKPRK